jgi:hypothetical protein
MQGGVQRAVLDLKYFVGAVFDDVSDGVAMGGAEQKGLQDEQIEGTLQEVSFEWRCGAFWHFRRCLPEDHLLRFHKMIYGREIRLPFEVGKRDVTNGIRWSIQAIQCFSASRSLDQWRRTL